MVKKIKPIYEENFYNLDREKKYEMILKKSLEMIEYVDENKSYDDSLNPYFVVG